MTRMSSQIPKVTLVKVFLLVQLVMQAANKSNQHQVIQEANRPQFHNSFWLYTQLQHLVHGEGYRVHDGDGVTCVR